MERSVLYSALVKSCGKTTGRDCLALLEIYFAEKPENLQDETTKARAIIEIISRGEHFILRTILE
jgi:hypothetical protein